MPLIAISSYMSFLITDLADGNGNTWTKNTRTRRRHLMRSWTNLIMTTTSATPFKIRASIVRVAIVGEHGMWTIKTTRGVMETSMMTSKAPTQSRR